eukprot:jgi/Bigna1/68260/fgenesh1_pg.5_\
MPSFAFQAQESWGADAKSSVVQTCDITQSLGKIVRERRQRAMSLQRRMNSPQRDSRTGSISFSPSNRVIDFKKVEQCSKQMSRHTDEQMKELKSKLHEMQTKARFGISTVHGSCGRLDVWRGDGDNVVGEHRRDNSRTVRSGTLQGSNSMAASILIVTTLYYSKNRALAAKQASRDSSHVCRASDNAHDARLSGALAVFRIGFSED